jgi:hypothetical protein
VPGEDPADVRKQIVVVQPQEGSPPAASAPEGIEEPAKVVRIASMVRQMLDEVRGTTIDEGGRRRLQDIYERSLSELQEVLPEDLRRELSALASPLDGVPSDSEIRLVQAQLVGWLEGLFHGMQAAMWAQQMQARAQLEEMRRRALRPGDAGDAGDAAAGSRDYRYL